jgi:hypothetical protein
MWFNSDGHLLYGVYAQTMAVVVLTPDVVERGNPSAVRISRHRGWDQHNNGISKDGFPHQRWQLTEPALGNSLWIRC